MASVRYIISAYNSCIDEKSAIYTVTGVHYPNISMIKFIISDKNCPEWIKADASMRFAELLGGKEEEKCRRERPPITYSVCVKREK